MSQVEMVREYMERKILVIWESRERAAILAKLRRALGKEAGTVPQVWDYTLNLPEALQGDERGPSAGETAVFTALTLFAMHAQGSADIVHRPGISLGNAVAQLRARFPENEKGIRRRFDSLVTAKSSDEIIIHARGLIQLLKAGEIDMDYSGFARDIYLLQFPEPANNVRLRWGREYFYSKMVDDQEGTENE